MGDISPVSAGASILLGPLGDMYRVSSQRSSNLGITSIQAISRTYGNVNILTNLTSQTMMAIVFQQEGFQKRGTAQNISSETQYFEGLVSEQISTFLNSLMEEPFHATSNNPIGEERKISLSQNNVIEWRQMNSGNVTKIKIYYQVFSLVVMVEGVIRKTSSTSIQMTITEFMVWDNNLENLSE